MPPIGLMSALEQSYFVRYPHKLFKKDYPLAHFGRTERYKIYELLVPFSHISDSTFSRV